MRESVYMSNSFIAANLKALKDQGQLYLADKSRLFKQRLESFLTSLDFQSRVQETGVAPLESCRCTSGRAAPDTWSPAAVTGSTEPS